MSAFRAFMIYDYQRNFFMLFVRLGFQVSLKWKDCRKELETKLVEMIKEPQEMYELSTDYGRFKCQYDKKNKCYFILLCSPEVNEQRQLEVLAEIYELIQKNPNYQKVQFLNYGKIKKDELESKQTNTVTKLLTKKEQEYITEFGLVEHFDEPEVPEKKVQMEVKVVSQHSSMQNLSKVHNQQHQQQQSNIQIAINPSQLRNHSGFTSSHDLNPDTLVKIFRGFMMWDYGRQFFFMFIRRGFPVDKTWSQERYKFEEELKAKMHDPKDPKAKPLEPPEEFDYKGDFGLYKSKYDKKNKCYFILLSRFKTKNEPQVKLLNALYDEVQKLEKYITLKYDLLESKKKNELIKIINRHEEELTKEVSRKFVDPKLFESKFGRIASPEERSRIASPQPNQLNSSNNLSSKKSSIYMSSGHLLQQYGKQDILAQDQEDIPEFTEQGELAHKLNKYQSAPLQVQKYVKQQN